MAVRYYRYAAQTKISVLVTLALVDGQQGGGGGGLVVRVVNDLEIASTNLVAAKKHFQRTCCS